jgi:hypothetical protein
MSAQSLHIENPVLLPIHITGRRILLAATLVVVTFSMLLCLCILFAYNAPLVFMTHFFASLSSLPATSVSALTFAITGGTAIILWTLLFLCARQERVAQHNKNNQQWVHTNIHATSNVLPTAPMQQRTKKPFFSQPATPAMTALHHKNRTTWDANFTREIEAKQSTLRLRQRSRELRLQTHGFVASNEDPGYQVKRIGTRNFYQKNKPLHQQKSAEQSAPFNEIYWWSTLPGAQEPFLKSTEGITKITHKMIREHTR